MQRPRHAFFKGKVWRERTSPGYSVKLSAKEILKKTECLRNFRKKPINCRILAFQFQALTAHLYFREHARCAKQRGCSSTYDVAPVSASLPVHLHGERSSNYIVVAWTPEQRRSTNLLSKLLRQRLPLLYGGVLHHALLR